MWGFMTLCSSVTIPSMTSSQPVFLAHYGETCEKSERHESGGKVVLEVPTHRYGPRASVLRGVISVPDYSGSVLVSFGPSRTAISLNAAPISGVGIRTQHDGVPSPLRR